MQAKRYVGCVALVACALQTAGAFAQAGSYPTSVEIALLPKFCWGQLEVPDADGPEYNIPDGCGWGMNHYCPGLVWLIRAKSATRERDRLAFLRSAAGEVRYTLRAIERYPQCPVRPHIEQTIAEIESFARVLAPETRAYRPSAPATKRGGSDGTSR